MFTVTVLCRFRSEWIFTTIRWLSGASHELGHVSKKMHFPATWGEVTKPSSVCVSSLTVSYCLSLEVPCSGSWAEQDSVLRHLFHAPKGEPMSLVLGTGFQALVSKMCSLAWRLLLELSPSLRSIHYVFAWRILEYHSFAMQTVSCQERTVGVVLREDVKWEVTDGDITFSDW